MTEEHNEDGDGIREEREEVFKRRAKEGMRERERTWKTDAGRML